MKFYIWLLTYNQHPRDKIRRYENNQKVDKFDEYDTFDSRGLLYEEESIKEMPLIVKKDEGWVHTSMPFYLYHDNKAFSGQYKQKATREPEKKGKVKEDIIQDYIYANKRKPVVVQEEVIQPQVVIKEKKEFTHTPMPFFLYGDDVESKGKYKQPEVKPTRKKPEVGEEVLTNFIYAPRKKETPRPVVVEKKEDPWVHTPMPMFMYYEDTIYKGKEVSNGVQKPTKSPKSAEETIQPNYVYQPEKQAEPVFIEPESSKKVVPVVVAKVADEKKKDSGIKPVKRETMEDHPIKPRHKPVHSIPPPEMEHVDMPSALLPRPPNIQEKFEPSVTKEDTSPVILIPATLREVSPEKPKSRDSPVKQTSNLMKSYREQTKAIERSRLTKMDELDDHNDMFVPMEPYKKDPDDCMCVMCIKNKSRMKKPERPFKKNPKSALNDKDHETHQKNKLESRIHRLPKLNKPKKIKDPYANRNRPRRSRPKIEQPIFKPDFSVSFAKFLKKNVETKEIKQKSTNTRNDDYLDSLGDDKPFKGKSRTSLDRGDNLDTYFDNERRR